jgi:hypothetical protein
LSTEQHPASFRADRRARLRTPGFSLARHFSAFGAMAAAATAIGIWLARSARPSDLWIAPVYLIVANVAEYLMHRLLMHRPIWPRAFYRGHTLGHHRAFHHDSMEIETWPELELVIMPWFSLAVFFVGMTPAVAAVGWAFGRGAAGLFLLTGIATFVLYEGMHTLYHFPAPVLQRLRLANNRVFRFLHDHHIQHHRLKRMRWSNFNISMPLSDACFGTLETEAAWLRSRDQQERTTTERPPTTVDDGKHAA